MAPDAPPPLTPDEEAQLRAFLAQPGVFAIEARQWMHGLLASLDAERAASADVLAQTARLRGAALEVWASVPASYDYDDPMVQRHAKALNAFGALVEEWAPFAAAIREQAAR